MLVGRRLQAVWAHSPVAWEQRQVGPRGTQRGGLYVSWLQEREHWGQPGALWLCSLWESGPWEGVSVLWEHASSIPGAMDSKFVPPSPKFHVEALTLLLMVFGDGPAHPQGLTPGH